MAKYTQRIAKYCSFCFMQTKTNFRKKSYQFYSLDSVGGTLYCSELQMLLTCAILRFMILRDNLFCRNESLFNWESIISMCTVDSLKLRSQPQFKELCETKGPAHCCPGWSLGGYIGLLHKRSSCFGIQVISSKTCLLFQEKKIF